MIVDIYRTMMPPEKLNRLICTLCWNEELKGDRKDNNPYENMLFLTSNVLV